MAIKFAGPLGGRLDGTGGDDVLWGAGGQDDLWGYGGINYLYGGSNSDTLHGGSGTDYLRGQGGSDDLYGESGTDFLWGGAGSDELWGGRGKDVLEGGSGVDHFGFRATDGTATDTIRDFTPGEDRLVLEDGLQVIQDFRTYIDFDGDRDTVLVLSNEDQTLQVAVVLLGLGTNLDWSEGGGNVLLA